MFSLILSLLDQSLYYFICQTILIIKGEPLGGKGLLKYVPVLHCSIAGLINFKSSRGVIIGMRGLIEGEGAYLIFQVKVRKKMKPETDHNWFSINGIIVDRIFNMSSLNQANTL